MRTTERSGKCSRKSWDFRRATIAFDSAFKEIELAANREFSERQTLCCYKQEDSRGQRNKIQEMCFQN